MKTQVQQATAIVELKKYYPELPDNLHVDYSLYLNNTPITTLPDNLRVNGNLYLNHTPITTLPDNLRVNGNLFIPSTQIITLPDNLQVSGEVVLTNTPVKSAKNWIISGNIGSRKTKTSYSVKDGFVRCGCFKGTIIEFENKVHATYPQGHKHRIEYDIFIGEIKNKI